MNNSLYLTRIKGIDIRMHVTFPLILVWGAIQYGLIARGGWTGALFGVVATLLLFVIVLLHELGHSLAAQRFGVPTRQIVLLPIGGVAQLASIPEQPFKEFVIAIAGPAVNFALAILFGLVALIFDQPLAVTSLLRSMGGTGEFSLGMLFNTLFFSNLYLAIFNLLPAFPMDGGRILRALLATRTSYPRATAAAAAIGQSIAFLLGLVGFLGGGLGMILIAVFIYIGAGSESQVVQIRNVLGNLKVDRIYSRQPGALTSRATLHDAVELTLNTLQADFPVLDGARLVGWLPQARLVQALDRVGPTGLVADIMLTSTPVARPQDDVFEVQMRMNEAKLDAIPVVSEQGWLLGVLTQRDISEVIRLFSTQSFYRQQVAA